MNVGIELEPPKELPSDERDVAVEEAPSELKPLSKPEAVTPRKTVLKKHSPPKSYIDRSIYLRMLIKISEAYSDF